MDHKSVTSKARKILCRKMPNGASLRTKMERRKMMDRKKKGFAKKG
jgi:hypothetical protein